MIAKGAVEDVMRAKAAALKDAVDVAVPDGDLIGAGDERPSMQRMYSPRASSLSMLRFLPSGSFSG